MSFAKLFETDLGQVLVKKDTNEDGNPEVRFYFEPPELGVCSVSMSAESDSDSAWDEVDAVFDKVDHTAAVAAVSDIFSAFAGTH